MSDTRHDSGGEPQRLGSSSRSASSFRKKSLTDAEVKTLKLKLHSAIVGNYSNPRKFFNKYDQDKDGRLAHDELKKCIRLGMKVKPSDLSDESVKDFIKVVDVDVDGQVSVDEICNFVGISVDDGSTLETNAARSTARTSPNVPKISERCAAVTLRVRFATCSVCSSSS